MTPLEKPLKRLLNIMGSPYVVTLTPDALKLTRKGRRLGMELKWTDLISGESALAVALRASVGQFEPRRPAPVQPLSQTLKVAVKGRAPRKSIPKK
jgi:hypothetical protein